MTKTCKKILTSVFLALCMVVCLFAIAACDNTSDTTVIYTITVQTDATTPASGVTVKIRKGGAVYSENTDEEGKATFELVPDDYDVELSKIPAHYNVPASTSLKLSSERRNITVTLEKNFGYTVKLVNPDGTPFYLEGVTVGICTLDGNCLTPVALGEDGVAIIDADASNYHVQILGLPKDQYTYDHDINDYYTGEEFTATKTEMTITINSITAISLSTPMTSTQKAEFASKNSGARYNADAREYTAYKGGKMLAAGETAYFTVTAPFSGTYHYYVNNAVDYLEDEFSSHLFIGIYTYVAGRTYTIKAINNSKHSAQAEFVLTVPFSTSLKQTSVSNSIPLSIGKANAPAIIEFIPNQTGIYKLSVLGSALTVVNASSSLPDELIASENLPLDSAYKANASVTQVITKFFQSGSPIYFTVLTKAATYPADVNVKLERTGNSVDNETDVAVTASLTKATKPAGTELFGLPMADGTKNQVLSDGNGGYTYDGHPVYVKITTPIEKSRYSSNFALAYMDMSSANPRTKYAFTTFTATGSDTVDYKLFLRGFKEYESAPGGIWGVTDKIPDPEDITTQTYYAKFVNDDGAYPLTTELKTFLEKFYEANAAMFNGFCSGLANAETYDSAWLLFCYYYDEEVAADPIVGEYKLSSVKVKGTTYNIGDTYTGNVYDVQSMLIEGVLSANSAVLRLAKDGSLIILTYDSYLEGLNESFPFKEGSWSKNGNYTFTLEDDGNAASLTYSSGTFTYSYTDGDSNAIEFTFRAAN